MWLQRDAPPRSILWKPDILPHVGSLQRANTVGFAVGNRQWGCSASAVSHQPVPPAAGPGGAPDPRRRQCMAGQPLHPHGRHRFHALIVILSHHYWPMGRAVSSDGVHKRQVRALCADRAAPCVSDWPAASRRRLVPGRR